MQDKTEIMIRDTLSNYPPPRVASNAVENIVALTTRNEMRHRLPAWTKRVVLSCYWLGALIGTIAIISSVPLPEWRPSALTPLAAWVVPVCGVLVLCLDPIVAACLKWRARYLSAAAN